MSHYRRAFIPGGIYFFTVVTYNRRPIFTDETRVEILRQALRKVMERKPFQIDAMVILPDHLHLAPAGRGRGLLCALARDQESGFTRDHFGNKHSWRAIGVAAPILGARDS